MVWFLVGMTRHLVMVSELVMLGTRERGEWGVYSFTDVCCLLVPHYGVLLSVEISQK